MTGRRRQKDGQGFAAHESWRRALGLYSDRLRRARKPTTKVRVSADLVCAALRRVDPRTADRAAGQVMAALTNITRDLGKEITR